MSTKGCAAVGAFIARAFSEPRRVRGTDQNWREEANDGGIFFRHHPDHTDPGVGLDDEQNILTVVRARTVDSRYHRRFFRSVIST